MGAGETFEWGDGALETGKWQSKETETRREKRDRNTRDDGSRWRMAQRENNIVSREHQAERQVDKEMEREREQWCYGATR